MFACALLEKQMVVICSNLVSKTSLAPYSLLFEPVFQV